MTLSRDDLGRLERLRALFLADRRAGEPLPDYWRDDGDLCSYDAVLGARIGWKWDAALAECRDRGFARADGDVVLDYGCGTGVAARRFVAAFGAREVLCHDRSRRAMAYASDRVRRSAPSVPARALPDVGSVAPDVLLVSHVLGELDAAGLRDLERCIARSRRVVVVEPGSQTVARALSALRDRLRTGFHVVAPCPHQDDCPALATGTDWCHFFAPPPSAVFTEGSWVRTNRALGIDARSLPYAFLCLVSGPAPAAPARAPRILGRPVLRPHSVRVQVCEPGRLRDVERPKRDDPTLWRTLKKAPESVRDLP
ncbi:MAG: methyltransferase domain-containing protein [Planctomycetes bacterium]|nr:methyltransferase domain-containing protein [Planctomycetota bacterium]